MATSDEGPYEGEVAEQLRAEAEYDSELIRMEPIPAIFKQRGNPGL